MAAASAAEIAREIRGQLTAIRPDRRDGHQIVRTRDLAVLVDDYLRLAVADRRRRQVALNQIDQWFAAGELAARALASPVSGDASVAHALARHVQRLLRVVDLSPPIHVPDSGRDEATADVCPNCGYPGPTAHHADCPALDATTGP